MSSERREGPVGAPEEHLYDHSLAGSVTVSSEGPQGLLEALKSYLGESYKARYYSQNSGKLVENPGASSVIIYVFERLTTLA